MKAFKTQSTTSEDSTISTRSYEFEKRFLVFSSDNNSTPEWMKNCKKRKISRVINLPMFYNSRLFKRIIQQNSKYIKSIKPCLYNDTRAISRMKQIKGLKEVKVHSQINIMTNYAKFIASMARFRGFFNLSALLLIAPLSKLTFVKNLQLEFPGDGYPPGFLFDIFKELSNLTELHSLQIKMSLLSVPKRKMYMDHIMTKFTKLKSLILDLNMGDCQDFGFLFTSLLPLRKLKHLELHIQSQNNIKCEELVSFISSLNLSTLKIHFDKISSEQYELLESSVKKNLSLECFSINQKDGIVNTASDRNNLYYWVERKFR